MARRTTPTPPPKSMTRQEMENGIRRLEKRLKEVEALDPNKLPTNDTEGALRPIEASVATALVETFGDGTPEYVRFESASYLRGWSYNLVYDTPHHEKVEAVTRSRSRSMQLIVAAINLLKERLEYMDEDSQKPNVASAKPAKDLKRVFVVHGHDDGQKEAVARLLQKLGLEPIILHEQANKGRTIIEKFREEASDVGFAVVLMSPDDVMADGAARPRQNVVLELGFFLGQLGPDRVATIVKEGTERPSDFDGVVYIPYESEWKFALAKELRAAGYKIDLNLL